MRRRVIKVLNKIGWWLMCIPWYSDATFFRSMDKRDWHCRLYFFGGRLAGLH